MLPNPKALYIMITNNCNYKCITCNFWKTKKSELLPISYLEQLIIDFSKLSNNGHIVFTGGEPLLVYERTFKLMKLSKELGLTTNLRSNLSLLLKNLDIIKYIDIITISLNSHIPEIQNKTRGVNDWKVLEKVSEKLLPMSNRPKLDINCLLTDYNLDSFIDTFYWSKKKGYDGFWVGFMVEQFNTIDQHTYKNREKAKKVIQYLIDNHSKDSFLMPPTLKEMILLLDNKLPERKCVAPYYFVTIDYKGEINFCFNPYNQIVNNNKIGNIKNISLNEIYNYSNYRHSLRKKLYLECKERCMIKKCHIPFFYRKGDLNEN